MPPDIAEVATISAAASSSFCPLEECPTLASCTLIPLRMQDALANDSVFILHRTQWQCLANSYSEVLRTLTHLLLQDACLSTALLGPAKQPIVGLLEVALLRALLDAERCMGDCTARGSSFSHSWLLDKALVLGVSTDVVDVHLHNFLWAFSALLNQGSPQIDTLESDLVQLTRALSDIWACYDSHADLSEACNLLSTLKGEYKLVGETCLLADFILHRLSHAQEEKSGEGVDVLPTYLWIDPDSLTKEPEILGEGAFGKVQEARWLGGRFAVKDFFYVENSTAFGSEAAIQASLRHPNVVSLICCTKNQSRHKCSLVLELMHQDLRAFMIERMKAGMDPPFSLFESIDLMLQIAKGMEYLHSLHIMHRDLKSSNVLVSLSTGSKTDAVDMDNHACPCAHLKIADFGMSKAKLASSKFTTRQVGATAWRAPEVFEINPEDEVEGDMNAKYTKKADVYSFGLVCYEILTGKCPFEGTQVRRRVLGGERPLIPSFCPLALSSYIKRCWHAEPTKRPPFIEICKMLRFLKAGMYQMKDYSRKSPAADHGWLSHPLSLDVCVQINRMSTSLVQGMGAPPRPQPVTMLLEMHCCRVVLEKRGKTGNTSNELVNNKTNIIITPEAIESSISTYKIQHSGCDNGKFSSKTKYYVTYVSRFVKKLLRTNTQLAKSELQDALGLVRGFTYEELRLATADFSKLVGGGGRGKVYRGRLHDGRAIAVKVFIHPQKLQSGHLVSSSETGGFVQELQIASQLRHRNIVTLFGWCHDRGKLLLVYEFMSNGSLSSHIFGRRNSLNWQRRYRVIHQLASALKYLHQDSGNLPIVHRDIKAANVLLDSGWNAHLGDCGLAVLLRSDAATVQTLAGTYGYIAPECVSQNLVSPALDVYAFGVTVLEIVTGRRAYTSDEMGEVQFVRDWVWELYQRGDPMEAADARLGGKFKGVEMQRLLRLGLSCTSAEPETRPHIEKVLKILLEQPCPSAETPSFGGNSVAFCSSTSSGSVWSHPMTEHLSVDGKEESELLTPRLENEMPRFPSVRVFTFNELKEATRNFGRGSIVGEGGFGKVYKGAICQSGPSGVENNSRLTVAVKVLAEESMQGHREWLTEVCFLGTLDHPHLVKLIGYCCENTRRLLVYEYMPNGSLDGHLYRTTQRTLQWATRMKIALDVAKGLAFLHGAERPILHRDLNTSNIMLDSVRVVLLNEVLLILLLCSFGHFICKASSNLYMGGLLLSQEFSAKLSDFGLVKYGPMGDFTHVSTRVLGTYGYAAPEYIATGHLTSRSDVYSFGVVLLELLTGQRCIDPTRSTGKVSLVVWVRPYLQHKQKLSQFIDPCLERCYPAEGALKAADLAFHCLSDAAKARPTMNNAIQTLESLQE